MEELILQNGYGLEEVRLRGSTGNRVSVSSRLCLVPWEWEQKKKVPQPAICYGARNETGEFYLEERMESEDLKLIYLLLNSSLFSGRLDFWVSGKCFLEFGWDNVMSCGRNIGGEDLWRLRKQGRLL